MIASRESSATEQTSTIEACLRRHSLLHTWIRYAYHKNKICFAAFVPVIPFLLPGMPLQMRWTAVVAACVIVGIFVTCEMLVATWKKNIRLLAKDGNPMVLGALLDFADVTFQSGSDIPAENFVEEERQILTLHLPNIVCKIRAGDYPDITQRQQNSLRWLVHHDYFRRYLCRGDLPDRISMILDQCSTTDQRERRHQAVRAAGSVTSE